MTYHPLTINFKPSLYDFESGVVLLLYAPLYVCVCCMYVCCMYVCMYVCMCVACMCVCMYVCVLHVCVYVCMYVFMCVYYHSVRNPATPSLLLSAIRISMIFSSLPSHNTTFSGCGMHVDMCECAHVHKNVCVHAGMLCVCVCVCVHMCINMK